MGKFRSILKESDKYKWGTYAFSEILYIKNKYLKRNICINI
jgi:hypothetical protein